MSFVLPTSCDVLASESLPLLRSRTLAAEEIAERVAAAEPFWFLRFMDGEFYSMFSIFKKGRRRNADGHFYYWDTMGRELRGVWEQAVEDGQDDVLIQMADCWHQFQPFRDFVEAGSCDRFVRNNVWVEALMGEGIWKVLEAWRRYPGVKVLAGEEMVEPVAAAIGAGFVVACRPNAYSEIDRVEDEIVAIKPDLVLSAIGMASECLLWRIRERLGRNCIGIDVGHVPSALMGLRNRRYLRKRGFGARLEERFGRWSKA